VRGGRFDAMSDASRLFSEKHGSYVRFIRAVGYPQGLRAFFLHSPLLRSGMRVLDAGCGTGVVTFALRDALVSRSLALGALHAFDLTPAMLERFRRTLVQRAISGVETRQADVLELDALPESWLGYDLIVSASMLEYVPRDRFVEALRGLRARLRENGRFVLFITRRNWLTRPLIGRWWRSNLYDAAELYDAFGRAEFSRSEFLRFPRAARHLALWGYVVEATR
jgi:SAM-dependent methyltransferase